jgi:hypothetical protein
MLISDIYRRIKILSAGYEIRKNQKLFQKYRSDLFEAQIRKLNYGRR